MPRRYSNSIFEIRKKIWNFRNIQFNDARKLCWEIIVSIRARRNSLQEFPDKLCLFFSFKWIIQRNKRVADKVKFEHINTHHRSLVELNERTIHRNYEANFICVYQIGNGLRNSSISMRSEQYKNRKKLNYLLLVKYKLIPAFIVSVSFSTFY